MKDCLCLFAATLIWCAVMPMLLRSGGGQTVGASLPAQATETAQASETSQPAQTAAQAHAKTPAQTRRAPIYIRVGDTATGKAETQELELYVAKALSALTAEGADAEALKASAVAVRTLVCFRHEHTCHEGFELCTDPAHCFALPDRARKDCVKAAEATEGLVLTRKGKASPAFSCPSFVRALPSAPAAGDAGGFQALLHRLFPDSELAQISAGQTQISAE